MDKVQLFTSVWNQYAPNVMYSTLSNDNKFNSIMLSDGTTKLLDLLLAMSTSDGLDTFLQNMTDINATVPLDSPFWPGCTVLHMAILMTDNMKLWDEFFANSYMQLKFDLFILQVYTSTGENRSNHRKRIDICLERGCRIDIKNSRGLLPIHLAFKLYNLEITDLLLSKYDGFAVDPDDLSFFHIACATGNVDAVKQLLNKGVNVNTQTRVDLEWFVTYSDDKKEFIRVPRNSTALHIAVTFLHKNLVEILLDSNADMYSENEFGYTPIHSSIRFTNNLKISAESIIQLLFERATNLRESLTIGGLSHLHVAAYADDTGVIKKLLQIGSNIDCVFSLTELELQHLDDNFDNTTPLNIAIIMQSCNAIDILIRSGADIFQQSPYIMTPLQELLRDWISLGCDPSLYNYIKDKLRRDERFNEPVDVNGTTLLHVACYTLEFEWAKELLQKGANVNAQILEDTENYGNWKGFTPMHLLVVKISEEIAKNNVDVQEMVKFLNLLIHYGANLSVIDNNSESPILLAHRLALDDFQNGDDHTINVKIGHLMFTFADVLLSRQICKINPMNRHGFSHFHYACMKNQTDIVEKFLDSGIDINHTANVKIGKQDATNFTGLHFAIYYRHEETACLLVQRGTDVNAVNGDKETPLHIAVKVGFINFRVIEILLEYGADINASSKNESTPIHYFFKHNNEITHEQLKFFINHGSKIDIVNEKFKGLLGQAMKIAEPSDRNAIFEELIVFFGIKNEMIKNVNPIESIVDVKHDGKLTLDFYLNSIQRFINFGCKLDRQNTQGYTALFLACIKKNLEAVEALILLGANVNIIDKNNFSPIEIWFTASGDDNVAKMLAIQFWKMKFVGMKVHEQCEVVMLDVHEQFPLAENLQNQCEIELAKMSEEKISGCYNLQCLLQDWSPIMDYPTILFVQSDKFVQLFGNPTNLHKDFPNFSGLLMMQYRKIRARLDMYKIAMNMLPSALHVDLPDLCLANILKFFDNDGLEYFIQGQAGTI